MRTREKITALCCGQGDVQEMIAEYLQEYCHYHNYEIVMFLTPAGDIASLVLPEAPSFKREAILFDLKIAYGRGGFKVLCFGHTICGFRQLMGADGKPQVYQQLYATPEVIVGRFPEIKDNLAFELYFVNGLYAPKRIG